MCVSRRSSRSKSSKKPASVNGQSGARERTILKFYFISILSVMTHVLVSAEHSL